MHLADRFSSGKAVVGLAAAFAISITAAFAARILVGQCLPESDAVEGWKVINGTYKECRSPDDLADLYDGGWEKYRDAGIIAAATQTYKKNRQIVIYVHEFSDAKKAKDYYNAQVAGAKKRGGNATQVKVPGGSGAYSVAGPVTVGNVVLGKVHGHVNAMGTAEDSQQGVAAFIAVLGEYIDYYY